MGKKCESCSFRLHYMLEHVNMIKSRPGLPIKLYIGFLFNFIIVSFFLMLRAFKFTILVITSANHRSNLFLFVRIHFWSKPLRFSQISMRFNFQALKFTICQFTDTSLQSSGSLWLWRDLRLMKHEYWGTPELSVDRTEIIGKLDHRYPLCTCIII